MNTVVKSAIKNTLRATVLGVCAVALTMGTAEAQRHGGGGRGFGGGHYVGHGGYYRGGWGGAGWVLGGLGIGLGVAAASSYYYPGYYGYPYGPPVYYTSPAAVVDPGYVDPGPAPAAPQQSQSSAAPAPIFYPRNGQTAAQTERDRQDCNRWATTQQNAMNDANVFQRATLACMDGRGYTVR